MLVPWVCSQRVQCSCSVASGSAAICACNAAYCPGAILGGRPERGLVATVPRSRRHCRQRVNERRLGPKLRAISAPLRPASAAWSTCLRSSSEYSGRFMPVVCHLTTRGRNASNTRPPEEQSRIVVEAPNADSSVPWRLLDLVLHHQYPVHSDLLVTRHATDELVSARRQIDDGFSRFTGREPNEDVFAFDLEAVRRRTPILEDKPHVSGGRDLNALRLEVHVVHADHDLFGCARSSYLRPTVPGGARVGRDRRCHRSCLTRRSRFIRRHCLIDWSRFVDRFCRVTRRVGLFAGLADRRAKVVHFRLALSWLAKWHGDGARRHLIGG